MRLLILAALPLVMVLGCGTTQAPARHGTMSTLSRSTSKTVALCEHKVPKEVCTRCNPQLEAKFKQVNDWCPEHAIPESQCLLCHPDLSFEPLPELPTTADLKVLSKTGEDVPSLDEHAVKGKATVFDFYADWCAPCQQVDKHMYGLLLSRTDIAYRKLNMVSWETPLTKRYLANAPKLPYLVVYGASGKEIGRVIGLDLAKLDQLIAEGARR